MAIITKPTDINKIWADAGDILTPSDSKIGQGWAVEIPPRQWFNWLDNRQDQFNAHINQHGISTWDATTEYQYSLGGVKSLVMGSDGSIYRAKQVNTNQDPTTDLTDTYWEVAFANSGDFYTKTAADARYFQISNDLSEVSNAANARTNLVVYSKSEVDGKTTVASTAQSQAWTSNTTLITPLRLSEAFKGTNQSLSSSGFQKLPGGQIMQWVSIVSASAAPGTTAFLWPVAFPTALHSVVAVEVGTAASSVSTIKLLNVTSVGGSLTHVFVLGSVNPAVHIVGIGS